MEKITLAFNVSQFPDIGYKECATLRENMSTLLDKELKQAAVGKWIGGLHTKDTIQVFLAVSDYEQAVLIIQSTLKDHWMLPLMEIERQSS
jgi:hypothetical protein